MESPLPRIAFRLDDSVRFVDTAYPAPAIVSSAKGPDQVRDLLRALEATDPDRLPAARTYAALPTLDRLSGPGTWDALTPFLYTSDDRFSSYERGAYYAAVDETTASAEWLFHAARRLANSGADRTTIEARVLFSNIDLIVTDARGVRDEYPALRDPAAGGTNATRRFAAELETPGLLYDSLRHEGGRCLAVFAPRYVGVPVREIGRIRFDWTRSDGWYRHP